jgi:UDP-N-acetylmuramoyl-L-alanyl-D-glutamate--2,6-diaminopimelate ligase
MTIQRRLRNILHFFYALYGAIRYRFPSRELFVIGITGTSGKSTTAYLLRQMLEAAGYTVGSLSTIDFYIAGKDQLNDQKMTMLGRGANHMYLRKMVDAGCTIAIVETTSEGALQHRHRFINYDTFIFTNLYPEHLEAHGGFEPYKQCKLDILSYAARCKYKFRMVTSDLMKVCLPYESKEKVVIPKTLIAPLNNEHVEDVVRTGFDRVFLFGRNDEPVYVSKEHLEAADGSAFAQHVTVTAKGVAITFEKRSVTVPMYGEHNAQNVLAVCATAVSLGVPWRIIFDAIAQFHNVPGRVEFIAEAEDSGFQIIVDYAFEPVALTALYTIVDLIDPKRVIHVCGSTGGGRDISRRPKIGEIAGTKADIIIVTNEDPYDEDPMGIIDAVAAGAIEVGKVLGESVHTILDRTEAIRTAISYAQPGDLVLVTGKGSEQGIMVAGGTMIPWDDREVVRSILRELYM